MGDQGGRGPHRRRALSLLLATGMLAALAWLAREHLSELHRLREIPPRRVGEIAVLYLAARAFGGEAYRVALARMGHPIGARLAFVLAIVTSYTNLFVPRTGLAAPAVYLRVRHRVPYAGYASVVVLNTLMGTCAIAFFATVVHLSLASLGSVPSRREVSLLFAAILVAAALGIAAPGPLFRFFPSRVRSLVAEAHGAWRRVAASPATLARLAGLQMGALALRALRLQLAFAAVGVELDALSVLLVSLCADLGSVVSLTPSALGFREGGLAFGAALAGVPAAAAVLAAVVDRLICSVTIVLLGQVFVWWGLRGLGGEPGLADEERPA